MLSELVLPNIIATKNSDSILTSGAGYPSSYYPYIIATLVDTVPQECGGTGGQVINSKMVMVVVVIVVVVRAVVVVIMVGLVVRSELMT